MDIEKLVKAFATYFREDEDIVRQIIVDNVTLDDMGFEPTPEQIEQWTYRFEDEIRQRVGVRDGRRAATCPTRLTLTATSPTRSCGRRSRRGATPTGWKTTPPSRRWKTSPAKVFDGLDVNEQTGYTFDMVLNLCDEIDKLKTDSK